MSALSSETKELLPKLLEEGLAEAKEMVDVHQDDIAKILRESENGKCKFTFAVTLDIGGAEKEVKTVWTAATTLKDARQKRWNPLQGTFEFYKPEDPTPPTAEGGEPTPIGEMDDAASAEEPPRVEAGVPDEPKPKRGRKSRKAKAE